MGFLDIFGNNNKDTSENNLDWNQLTELKQLDEIASESSEVPVAIFKHSTRCGISRMALKGFEADYSIDADKTKLYFLDLLNNREVSNAVSEKFGIRHESPQLILVKDGKAVYSESHGSISAASLKEAVGNRL